MPFWKQLANWWTSAVKLVAINLRLVLPETRVMQVGQLVANLTDRLVMGNPA